MTQTLTAAAIGAAVATAALSASCGSTPAASPSACKAAMTRQYQAAVSSGHAQQSEPAACKGLPKSELARFAFQISGANTSPAPLPSPSPSVPALPVSRANCKKELKNLDLAVEVVRGDPPPAACQGQPASLVQNWATNTVTSSASG